MPKSSTRRPVAVVDTEIELERARARSDELERLLVGELGQELVGIALLVAAARTPGLDGSDMERRLHRIAELLSVAIRRCAVVPALIADRGTRYAMMKHGQKVH